MNQIVIRTMTTAEIGAVSTLLCDCYRWLARREGYSPEQTEFLLVRRGSEAVVRKESGSQHYLVACSGEVIVGMAAISNNEITKLYVAPSHHGEGIGRLLYQESERLIGEVGFPEVVLGTTPGSMRFYEVMGMSTSGRIPYKIELFSDREVVLMHKRLT